MKRLADVDAYVTGELDDAAAAAFEEAMFDAPDDPDVALLDVVARRGAWLADHGTFETGVTRAQLDALVARGLRVQVVDGGGPGARRVQVDDACELFVTRLELGRRDLDRVDVEIEVRASGATKVIRDVLVDPSDGAIYGLCERPLAMMAYGAGHAVVTVRERSPARAVLGQWSFNAPPENAEERP